MAKLTQTRIGIINQKAMLYGHVYQKAFVISLILNIGLLCLLYKIY